MNISKNSILKADFRIEFSKYASIILNFLNVIAFSFLYGEGALIDYVFYISLSIILNAIFDQGLNTLNCDMQLKKNIFYSYDKQYSLKFISFLLLLITTLFVLFDDSYLILIACLIQVLPGTYIMRFLSVKRRSQEILSSVVYGELLPALLKFFIIISFSFFASPELALLSISFGILIFSTFLKNKKNIKGLNIIWHAENNNYINFKFSGYALSIFFSVKNQIFGIFLPSLASENQKTLFALLSNSLIISLLSPIIARIPLSIEKGSIDFKFYAILNFIFLFVIVNGIFFWEEILNIFSIIFSSGEFELNTWAFFLFSIMLANIIVIFNSQIMLFLGKINLSFALEFCYFLILLCLIIYNF